MADEIGSKPIALWACGFEPHLRHIKDPLERRLGELAHEWGRAPRTEYAYLLGMYLGDGCITKMRRTQLLRITLDSRYPQIIEECRSAMAVLMPHRKVSIVRRPFNAVDVACSSILWPELLPQDGAGPKHQRPIHLQRWQERVVEAEPEAFLRGLFHSDGTYVLNVVRSRTGKTYAYDRYFFSNRSEDIKDLFRWACSLIAVETRVSNAMNISVASRGSVGRLNRFLGPKR